jgi:hypothetical protein
MSERVIGYRIVGKVVVNSWAYITDEQKIRYAKEFADEFVKGAERHLDDVNPRQRYGTFVDLYVEPVYEEDSHE